jgi:5'-nucleotidase
MPQPPAASNEIANTPPSITKEPASATETQAQAPAVAEPASGGAQKHVIARGDNFWRLAEKFYGDGKKWHVLQEANPEFKPRFLPIGSTLKVPAAN